LLLETILITVMKCHW